MSERTDAPESATYVDAFARGLAVIEAFGPAHSERTMSQVAATAGISRAAARRLLLTLCRLGYAQETAGGFRLTPKVMRLGYSYLSGLSVAEIAEPAVVEVAEKTGESCSVCVLDDLDVVYVARASTRRVMSLNLSIGTRLPAWATAHGRVLLGALDDADLDDRLRRSDVRRLTPHTQTSRKHLAAAIRQSREEGHCLVDEELEVGLTALAMPLRAKGGKVVAAINLAGHGERLSAVQLLTKHLPTLRHAADAISSALAMR